MKAAATALDVEAVRVTFALEAEEWFVEQFDQHGYGRNYLERYLGRPLDERLLTGEEREKLQKHLREIRKTKGGSGQMERADGKPRNVRGYPVAPINPGPMIHGPRGPVPGPGR